MANKPYLYLHTPTPLFKARVNMPTVTYPVSSLTYDGVTLGAFADITFDATLLLGTFEGGDDLGRVRVKSTATITTIPIGRASQGIEDGMLDVQDDAYITVLHDYRVWAKIPYFDLDAGIDYKDGDVPPGDFTTTGMVPKANCGAGAAGYIDPVTGLMTVTFPHDGINTSFAVTDGATITTYAWFLDGGSLVSGSLSDAVITATFPAGFYWVALTVTDSNGVTHTSRCPVLAIDPTDDPTIQNFHATQRLTIEGNTLDLEIFEDIPRTEIPDGTLVMYWWDEAFSSTDRNHIKFIGWTDSENFSVRRIKQGVTKSTTLHCVDVAGRLSLLPGFPQALERFVSEELGQWSHMPSLDMHKALMYIGFWYSTAFNLADFILPDDLRDYDAVRLDANGGNLFDQLSTLANKIVPDHFVTVNTLGQMEVKPNWIYQDEADRPEVTVTLTENEYNNLQGDYSRHPKYHSLRSGAVLVSEDFVEIDGEDTVPTVFSIAPGISQAFTQGLSEANENEGLALSQEQLNSTEGHRFALLNSRYGTFSFQDPSAFLFWEYEPASLQRVEIEMAESYHPQRGLGFTSAAGQIQEITVRLQRSNRGIRTEVTCTWKKEELGSPAVTYIPDVDEEVGYEPSPPPDLGLVEGQDLVAGIGETSLFRTTDFTTLSGAGGPTWTEHNLTTSEEILSWVVDPFSPGYLTGSGAINGWVVTAEALYRVTDIFGTVGCTAIHTFSVALGTSTVPEQEWRTVQASFGAFFESGNPWLMVVSHYRDAAGHAGTWALYSEDGGATFENEVQISAHYDSGTGTDKRPIALYLSPKTPGYALAVAYTATSDPAPASGYVTSNWGATWAVLSSVDTGVRLGGDYHIPWLATGDATIYHGRMAGSAETDPDLLPIWATMDEDNVLSVNSPGPFINASVSVSASTSSLVDESIDIMLAPPKTAKRVAVTWNWECISVETGPSSGGDGSDNFDLFNGSGTSRIGNDDFVSATPNTTTSGSFTTEWSFTGGNWPLNSESIIATPPASPTGCRLHVYVIAAGTTSGGGNTVSHTINVDATITEIELDDGTIYTPVGDSLRSFSLRRVNLDTSFDDLSPVSSDKSFGPNAYGFTIRAYDSNKQYMVLCGTGNDVSADDADDYVGVWVSSDSGSTWTEIVAPVNSLDSYHAAFAGDSEQVIFLWGPANTISFSSDLGANFDSRAGNLSSFGTVKLIGICGGP